MTGPMHDRIEQAYAELDRQREALNEVRADLREGTFTATDKRRLFTVTVDARGELTGIRFLSGAYRGLAPADLAERLVAAVGEARAAAMAQAVGMFQGLLPELPMAQIMSGTLDLGAMFDEAVLRAEREDG
jgi:hypothetical protein